jgi:Uma2 family endonuclease
MVAAITQRPLTWEDLIQTPETGERFEIMQGELIVTASPNTPHQLLSTTLTLTLGTHIKLNKLGVLFGAPVDVRLTPHDVLAPDLVFVAEARRGIIQRQYIEGAPDLVVEILSPSTRGRDLVRKTAIYLAGCVQEYWQVDHDAKTLVILALRGDHYEPIPHVKNTVTSEVLKGLTIVIAELFANVW